MMDVVEAWLNDLSRVLAGEPILVSEVRIGPFYTAAELSTGEGGVAFTPRDLTDTVCCPASATAAPQAGRLAGQDAWVLARGAVGRRPLWRAVGVAVLNALSASAIRRQGVPGGRLVSAMDALEAAEVQQIDRVALIGGFSPFIRALKDRVTALWVIDRHREGLKPDAKPFWRPPRDAAKVISEASVVIITGSALVEGGIDALLTAAQGARRVILAGPTASAWPPPFFERGVHVLGGLRVRDARALLQIVSEGGSGHTFGTAAEKICVVRENGHEQIGKRDAA